MTHQQHKSKWRQNPNEPQDAVVFNEHNHRLNASGIHQIWSRYSRSPIAVDERVLALFRTAVTHRSYVRSIVMGDGAKRKKGDLIVANPDRLYRRDGVMDLQEESYDRLELVGDSIFHCVLTKYLFNRFQTQDEGFLTRLRAKIENGDSMSVIAKKLHLEEWVVISAEQENEGKRKDDKILEDVFEALMGAMFLSFGYPKCEEIILNICHRDIDFPTLLQNDGNFKDQLLRRNHRAHIPDPTYGCRQEDYDKSFTAWVIGPDGKPVSYGNAKSKPKAEQLAARRMLEQLNLIGADGEAYMNTKNLDVLLKDTQHTELGYADNDIQVAGTRSTHNNKNEKLNVTDTRVSKLKSDKKKKNNREIVSSSDSNNSSGSDISMDTGSEDESDNNSDSSSGSDNSNSNSNSSGSSASESDSEVDAITARTSKQRDTRVQNHRQNLQRRVIERGNKGKGVKVKSKKIASSDDENSTSENSSDSSDSKPAPVKKRPVKKVTKKVITKTKRKQTESSDSENSNSSSSDSESDEEEKVVKKPTVRSNKTIKKKKVTSDSD